MSEELLAKQPLTTPRDFKLWREFDMGMTQDQIAGLLGYKSRQSVAKLETGKAKITTRISKAIELITREKFGNI